MTKTVALADDAYASLARLKKPGQSFSDVVRELASRARPRLEEVLPDPPTKEEDAHWEAFANERREARKVTTSRVSL